MRALIQRVKEARVKVAGQVIGEIGTGLLVFLGVSGDDTEEEADLVWRKLSRMRIFADDAGKTNLDIKQVSGNILLISQFTLYADCKKGNRPSFTKAGSAEIGNRLYQYMLNLARSEFPDIQSGQFGADMQVELVNDGPFTIILDSDQL